MLSLFSLHGPPYAKAPLKWGPHSNWHISVKLRMVLFGKRKLNVLISVSAHWCLKWKNCIGWLLSSIAFQIYSVSNFTLADCVLTFLPWKGKSPHYSQYWKPFLQHLNRPIHREVDSLGLGSTMLVSATRCILKTVWNMLFISKLERPVISRDQWVFQK